ncbi:MAG: alpha/beta fold hydrolase, partial [Pseudomonadota bacterium]|nr:alpha/beta fold hydrolase [Pseudomonadota bacterium]
MELRKMLNNAIQRRVNRERFLLHNRTPRTEILREGIFSVQYFAPLPSDRVQIEGETVEVEATQATVPLVLVPPLGVYAWIFDLMAERSLVRYFLARGFSVYLVDWGQPNAADSHLTLEKYALDWLPKAVDSVRAHAEQPQVSLLGYCMGGLLAMIYTAALGGASVRNLVTIASPVNLHQMSGAAGVLNRLASIPTGIVKRVTGLQLTELHPKLFHVHGRVLSVLFKMTQPKATVSSYVGLVKHLADDDYVSRYMTMNEWFTNMPDYPGATVQEVIQRWGLANGLANGQLNLSGRPIDLANITCSLLAFAGDNDAITSIPSASAVISVVRSTDISF